MKPPISFILDLILDHQLPPDALKACRKYIRELEQGGAQHTVKKLPAAALASLQAPSTIALMEKHAANPQIQAAAPLAAPTSSRIVGGEVATGNGTRGPKKW